MNKFEKQLEKWNNGILRGAQAKLAKTLGVSTATAALWATGKRRPSKGYVAQRAVLFGMDVYGVLKLFDNRSTTYPDPSVQNHARTLRDKNMTDCSYNACGDETKESEDSPAQSNSVRLPFLACIPTDYPHYDECDVIEWWSVPRRYALGAKYIIRSSDAGMAEAADADDLCFVKPCTDTPPGACTLYALPGGKFAVKITRPEKVNHHAGARKNAGADKQDTKDARTLGMLTRRIRGF